MSHIVLIGIGGTGMSGIAGILHELGFTNIIGIDASHSQITDRLEQLGISIIYGHGNYKVQEGDTIIYSEAAVSSPEVIQAKKLTNDYHKTTVVMNYFQFLGEISKYFSTVGIAGSNGKSTTTAMALHTIPHFIWSTALGIVGALVSGLDNKNYFLNSTHKSDIKDIFHYIFQKDKNIDYNIIKKYYFIVEACEYKRHFLHLDLDYTCITNIELDHTDYYQDLDDYTQAFSSLIHNTKYKALMLDNQRNHYPKLKHQEKITRVAQEVINRQYIRGWHNNDNGSLVLALTQVLQDTKQKKENIISHLEKFLGLRRRMENIAMNIQGAKIISDYAHMPSSLDFVSKAIQEHFPGKQLVVILQPHQINRVLRDREEFRHVLQKHTYTAIYTIYAAREQRKSISHPLIQKDTTVEELSKKFADYCHSAYYETPDELITYINNFNDSHIILLATAGDLDYQIRQLLST